MTLLLVALALAWAPSFFSWGAAELSGRPAGRPGAAGVVRLAGYAVAIPLVLWVLARAGRPASELLAGFAPLRLAETVAVGLGAAAGLGFLSLAAQRGGALLLAWAYRTTGRAPSATLPSASVADSAWRFPAPAAFGVAVGAAGYEELVWRGLLQAGLVVSLGAPAAVTITALAFAALHARQGPVAVGFSAVAAALLGIVFVWREDLAAVALAHAAYNASAVVMDRWGPPAARRAAGARLSVPIPG